MKKLIQLNVGDSVILYDGNLVTGKAVLQIERLTDAQAVIGNMKFWRKNCNLVGSNVNQWNHISIHVPQDGQIDLVQKENRKAKLVGFLKTRTGIITRSKFWN